MVTRRRFFSNDEKWDLYRKSNGRCQICHIELHEIFQADHVVPFSQGGETSIANGQVLCGNCNRIKSASNGSRLAFPVKLHDWQQRAFDVFLSKAIDSLISATPGAGKTIFALYVIHYMRMRKIIDFVVIVVPTDELREQWLNEAANVGIDLDTSYDPQINEIASDFFGIVTTYATIAKRHESPRKRISNLLKGKKVMLIADEIHHVGESLKYATSMMDAFAECISRLLITGTPFRNDNNRIPFVNYRDLPGGGKECIPDFTYSYGDALRDGVVRPIYFPSFPGEASWFNGDGDRIEVNTDEELPSKVAAQRLRMLIHEKGDWLVNVISEANHKLEMLRYDDPRAGGLIVTKDTNHAHAVSKILIELRIDHVVVASLDETGSPDKASSDKIREFRSSKCPWIVAVKMVSEGVDIKRLRVGVWATNVQSSLFFYQVVGRILRIDRDGLAHQTAFQYIPKVDSLTELAEGMKTERNHVVDDLYSIADEIDEDRERIHMSGSKVLFDWSKTVGDPSLIHGDTMYSPSEIAEAKKCISSVGEVPTDENATLVAKILRVKVASAELHEKHDQISESSGNPRSEKIDTLKSKKSRKSDQIKKMLGQVVNGQDGIMSYEEINRTLAKVQKKRLGVCTLDEYEERLHLLIRVREAIKDGQRFDSEGRLYQFLVSLTD